MKNNDEAKTNVAIAAPLLRNVIVLYSKIISKLINAFFIKFYLNWQKVPNC